MKKVLFYLAVTGWALGLTVHLLSVAGIDVEDTIPFVWTLHIGAIFVPGLATLITNQNKNPKANERTEVLTNKKPLGSLKALFSKKPTWLTIIVMGGFYYALINFALFISSHSGQPDFRDGQYILHNHGEVLKILTEQEYHLHKAYQLRGFSGHWIAFFGFAVQGLFPFVWKKTDG